jgi:hypothetical protein
MAVGIEDAIAAKPIGLMDLKVEADGRHKLSLRLPQQRKAKTTIVLAANHSNTATASWNDCNG